jgi:hypothetical protein
MMEYRLRGEQVYDREGGKTNDGVRSSTPERCSSISICDDSSA